MQNLRFAMAAGETKIFELAGRYLEIIESAGPVTIELYDANGGQSDEARDVLSGTYMTEPYARIAIYSATAQTVELFLSARGGGTKRQPGTVNVVDSDRATTIADQAINAKISQVAVAGQFPYLQIWNPPGSGVVLTIEKLTINCSQACNFTLARETVQSGLSALQYSDSKRWTLAAPKLSKGAKIIGTSAVFGALGNNTQLIMPANQPIVYQPKRPIVIYGGVGMGMWADVVNTAVVVMAEWVESVS